jgi:hypothetical protein
MGEGQAGTAQWEFLAEKLLYLGMTAVVIWSFLFIDFPGHGRLWDRVCGISPLTAEDMAALSSPKKTDLSKDDGKDRLLISPRGAEQDARGERPHNPTAAELVSQIPDAFAGEGAGNPKLTSQLWSLDDPRRAATQRTSASIAYSASARPGPSVATQTSLPVYSMEAPRDDEGRPTATVASRRRNSSRNEIMGRSAGPVYNITNP